MQNIKIISSCCLLLTLISASCKDKKVDEVEVFEKGPILEQMANNYITPAIDDVKMKIDNLSLKWSEFGLSNTESKLDEVKTAWESAYVAFQYVKMFDFGPFTQVGYSSALGTFPSDTSQIENNISTGQYDLSTISNTTAIGFPALDYLFFEQNAFNNLNQENNRKIYVNNVISKMKVETDLLKDYWNNYINTFKAGTGTSSTSIFSLLVNGFCKDFEICKNAKIGIPLGKQSLGIQRLEFLEARYSKIGTKLIIENQKALRTLFMGNSLSNQTGIGFDDYLIALEKQSLSTTIETRFDYLIQHPSTWSENLESMMQNQTTLVDSYYNYMHGTVVYLKTDMSSAFGILITYQDNDGD